MSASSFALELLDTESGHVLQTWEFGDGDVFQLGRSRECDIVFPSLFVSRTHACLQFTGDGWELSSVSRSGVFVEGQRVDHLRLEEGQVFRLADRGPTIRFRSIRNSGSGSAGETICFDASRTPLLLLDEQQRDEDVTRIVAGDYFQELQRKVARLRVQPLTDESFPTETPS